MASGFLTVFQIILLSVDAREARDERISLCHSPPYLLKEDLSLCLELARLARLAGIKTQISSCLCVSSSEITDAHCCMVFCMHTGIQTWVPMFVQQAHW